MARRKGKIHFSPCPISVFLLAPQLGRAAQITSLWSSQYHQVASLALNTSPPPPTPPLAERAINSADRGSSCNLHLTYSSVSCRSSTIEWFVRSAGMSAVTEEQRARDKVADTGDED